MVVGNRIGISIDGDAGQGGLGNPVGLRAASATDGVVDSRISRNVISGNASHGIQLAGAVGNLIDGNHIGVTGDGAAPLPNGGDGIRCGVPCDYRADADGSGGMLWLGGVAYGAEQAPDFVDVALETPPGLLVPNGWLVATATDASGAGNTSEFSGAVPLRRVAPACGLGPDLALLLPVAAWLRRARRSRRAAAARDAGGAAPGRVAEPRATRACSRLPGERPC